MCRTKRVRRTRREGETVLEERNRKSKERKRQRIYLIVEEGGLIGVALACFMVGWTTMSNEFG